MQLQSILDLSGNSLLAAGVGTAIISGIMMRFPVIMAFLKRIVERRLFTTITLDNKDNIYEKFLVWLSYREEAKKTRYIRIVEKYDFTEKEWQVTPTFGDGWNMFRYAGMRIYFHRSIETAGNTLGLQRKETIVLRALGLRTKKFRKLITEIDKVWDRQDSIYVYAWDDGAYQQLDIKKVRDWSQIYLPENQKKRIVADLDRFTVSKAEYERLGVPYRRGYLFYGPPGTGKTSLAFTIASHVHKPIYIINPKNIKTDVELLRAFSKIENGSVVLIEDIDAFKETHNRDYDNDSNSIDVKNTEGISMSGLLNAMDGVGSRDNRILIITTNHIDVIDEAVRRPGRVDMTEEVDHIRNPEVLREMAANFLQDDDAVDVFIQNTHLPISPAAAQVKLFSSKM